jgi:HK97 family phage portal protein
MTTDSAAIAERLMQMVSGADDHDELRAAKTRADQFGQPSTFFVGGAGPAAGVLVTESTALSVSAVFACVRNLAEDEAKLPFIVYRRLNPRGKERLPGHPLYRMLHDSPNPEMSAFDFRQAITACAVLWGGGYAEIERDNSGLPLNLWPIEPWRVVMRRDRAGALYYDVDSGKARLTPDDILHIKGFGTDGVVGMMVAKCGRESLGLTMAAQRFAAGFFGNGARLSGILEHPNKLSPTAHKNLKESFKEDHVGPDRSHGFAVLEEGAKWHQTSAEPNEAQMIETRQFQIEDVARWFRMPPHKIQHLLRSTFSNIEHQSIEYVQDTLMPWFVRWEQESKRKLVSASESDVFAEHLVDGMLRGDSQARANALHIMRQDGIISGDEWRELENMNPIPDGQGDVYLVNGNMIPISSAAVAPPPNRKPGDTQPVKTEADNSRSLIVEAHRPALLDAAARAVRREVEVIRRKAKNPDTVRDAIGAFYATHGDYVRNALRPSVTAFTRTLAATSGDAIDAETSVRSAAEEHLRAALPEMIAALTESPEHLEATLAEWETTRAGTIVDSVIKTTRTQP